METDCVDTSDPTDTMKLIVLITLVAACVAIAAAYSNPDETKPAKVGLEILLQPLVSVTNP